MNITANQTRKEFKTESKNVMRHIANYSHCFPQSPASIAIAHSNIKRAVNKAWRRQEQAK